jgi:hypothetical protein
MCGLRFDMRMCLSLVMLVAWMSTARAGIVLITAEEARLPPPQNAAWSRGITRAPRIELAAADDGHLHSPIHFQLRLHAFGGASIDVGSVEVTYLRISNIDLTPRLRPFIRATGIDVPEAEIPPGEHMIRVNVRDSEGRQATSNFVLSISPD